MISKESAELFLDKEVLVFTNGRILVGFVTIVSDHDLVLRSVRFGRTIVSLSFIDEIKEREMNR